MNEKGFNIYWQNYRRAFEWQTNSQISHWKARARALEVENALLKDYIQRGVASDGSAEFLDTQGQGTGFTDQHSSYSGHTFVRPHQNDPKYFNSKIADDPSENQVEEVEENEEGTVDTCHDPEIDEELLAFYEKTIRHKIERKKKQMLERQRDSEDSQSENEKIYSMGPIPMSHKSTDMALLYGDDAPKILSMELSMQINFDMNCSKCNPQLWPNIPLRLS